MKYNEEAAFQKYQKIYHYISPEKKNASEFSKGMLEQAVRELNTQVGIPAKLSDAGVTDEHFSQMTDDAMKSGNIAVNPWKPGGRIFWRCIKRRCKCKYLRCLSI